MTSEDTDTASEYIDKFLLDYFREESNPVITTANMMEDLMLLEDKEPEQTEKYPKTSVGGSDPVLGAQNFENFSLEEKIVRTSVGGQQTEKYPKTSVGGSDSGLDEQNVDNFLLEDQIEKEVFVNGLSDKNGSLPGNGLISPLTSPLEPVESLHSQSTCLAGNQLASGSLCSRSARRFSSATSLRLLAACFAAMKQLAARFACIRFVSTRIAALAIILLCSQAARSLLRSH